MPYFHRRSNFVRPLILGETIDAYHVEGCKSFDHGKYKFEVQLYAHPASKDTASYAKPRTHLDQKHTMRRFPRRGQRPSNARLVYYRLAPCVCTDRFDRLRRLFLSAFPSVSLASLSPPGCNLLSTNELAYLSRIRAIPFPRFRFPALCR